MSDLKESFEDVADWCEKHLEAKWGQEIGMTFGAMLRFYGRLATLPPKLRGEQRVAREQDLTANAEKLLSILSMRCLMAFEERDKPKYEMLDPNTNYTFDGLCDAI
jgi:hypothetical protein